MESLISD